MSVREFDKRFGLNTTLDEEESRFVTRINQGLFRHLETKYSDEFLHGLFRGVCYKMGEDPTKLLHVPLGGRMKPHFKLLSKDDFIQTLRTITAIYEVLGNDNSKKEIITWAVNTAINHATSNLMIKWVDGVFYPSGEDILDKELVDGALQSLDGFPNENKDIRIALTNYQSGRLDGVIENCYLAVEGLSRKILDNGKTLLNNKGDLLQLLGFSKYWGNMLSAFIEYANEFRRHAGEDRHNLKPSEVEAFLYLTCLFIRAIVRAHQANKK